jgi:hypothetical protein
VVAECYVQLAEVQIQKPAKGVVCSAAVSQNARTEHRENWCCLQVLGLQYDRASFMFGEFGICAARP